MGSLLVALAVAVSLPATVTAQPGTAASPRLPRGDIATTVGWLNSDVSTFTSSEHDWTHAQATLGIHGGYYWTEHLKTEAALERSSKVTTFTYEQMVLPGGALGFRGATHDIRYTRGSIGQMYQFGHNAWVHAAVGGGVAITAQHATSEYRPLTYYDARGEHIVEPSRPDSESTDTIVRGFAAATLKAYLTPRAFFRSDVQADFRSTLDTVVLRAGFGVDF